MLAQGKIRGLIFLTHKRSKNMAKLWHRKKKAELSDEIKYNWAGRAAKAVCKENGRNYFSSLEFVDNLRGPGSVGFTDGQGVWKVYSVKFINANIDVALAVFGYKKFSDKKYYMPADDSCNSKGRAFYIYYKDGHESEVIPEAFYDNDWLYDIIDGLGEPDVFKTTDLTEFARANGIAVNKRTIVGSLKYLGYEKYVDKNGKSRWTKDGVNFGIYVKIGEDTSRAVENIFCEC